MKNTLTCAELTMKVDLTQLKRQKKLLLCLSEHYDNMSKLAAVYTPFKEDLEGLICLIDAIQDKAVDELGFDENDVFDLEPSTEK